MSTEAEKESALVLAIQDIERIASSGADAGFIYARVFYIHGSTIRPMLDNLGIDFDYYDPDTSYEEDVAAYVRAIRQVKENLLKTLGVEDEPPV